MFDKEESLHRNKHKEITILCLLKMPKLLNFSVPQSLTKMVLIIKVLSKS